MEKEFLGTRNSLKLERYFPLPPEKVWWAWTDPQALAQWSGLMPRSRFPWRKLTSGSAGASVY